MPRLLNDFKKTMQVLEENRIVYQPHYRASTQGTAREHSLYVISSSIQDQGLG